MELKKQELLVQRFADPAEKEKDSTCVICGDKNTEVFIFPTCRMVHYFACEDCIPKILRDGGSVCRFPGCENDTLLRDEFGKTVEQHRREWVENSGTTVEPLAIDLLILAIPELLTETILLKRETAVTLKNIALSDVLLFKLLKKTKIVVGENVSVFGSFKNEDCIREGMNARELCLLRPASFPWVQNSVFFMENIARMPNGSVLLGKVKKLELNQFTINTLPKLVLHKENVMEEFRLNACNKEYVSEIIHADDNSILLGKVKRLELKQFAINALPKLVLHKENVMDEFSLEAAKEEYVSEIIQADNNSIWLGKVKRLVLGGYAANALPKLVLHKENVMEEFRLNACNKEHISEIMKIKDGSILLGKVKKLELKQFEINALPKLVLHKENVMDEFSLEAAKEEYVSEIIHADNNSIWFGKVKRLALRDYAANALPKLVLHKENVMEEFSLNAWIKEHVFEIKKIKDGSVLLGKVKKLELNQFAINALPKLVLHKENVMEEFRLNACNKEYVSEIIHADDNSILLGKVKRLELKQFAINALPKLVLHKENVMDEFSLEAAKEEYVSEIIQADNNSIWFGKVKRLALRDYAANALPKLVLHKENVMEELSLDAWNKEHISEIMKIKDGSIRLGKIKKFEPRHYTTNIVQKLSLEYVE
ncbi:MAG: uncharacterized protein A8A55_2066 [Amphiamblys sp. WSBS2006]|nr:MAG: uncharacterized protein A8A55_2066 [Amphiamblys sp. WSBS2006]